MKTTNKLTIAFAVSSLIAIAALGIALSDRIWSVVPKYGFQPEPWILVLASFCALLVSASGYSFVRSIRRDLGAGPEEIEALARHLSAGRLSIASLSKADDTGDADAADAAAYLAAAAERLSATLRACRDVTAKVENACGRIDIEAYRIRQCCADPNEGVKKIEAESKRISSLAEAIREEVESYSFLEEAVRGFTSLSPASRQFEIGNLAVLRLVDPAIEKKARSGSKKRPARRPSLRLLPRGKAGHQARDERSRG